MSYFVYKFSVFKTWRLHLNLRNSTDLYNFVFEGRYNFIFFKRIIGFDLFQWLWYYSLKLVQFWPSPNTNVNTLWTLVLLHDRGKTNTLSAGFQFLSENPRWPFTSVNSITSCSSMGGQDEPFSTVIGHFSGQDGAVLPPRDYPLCPARKTSLKAFIECC